MGDKPEGIWDKALKEVGFAVDDIRQKVVEEPWFGRPETPKGDWHLPGLNKEAGDKPVESADLYGRDAKEAERGDWDIGGSDTGECRIVR